MTTVRDLSPGKRKALWIFLGVCAAILLLVVILGSCTGGGSTTTASSSSATPTTTAKSEPPKAAEPSAADALTKLILDGYAAKSFGEILAQNPNLWGGRVTSITVSGTTAHIRTTYSTDDKADGARAAKAAANFIRNSEGDNAAKRDIRWVTIENGVGTVIDQAKV